VAGALAELLDVAVRHDGFTFERSKVRIVVVDGVDRLLTAFKRPPGPTPPVPWSVAEWS